MKEHEIRLIPIGHIRSPYQEKFGIPRQAGLVDVAAEIVFDEPFRVREALRGIEEYSYLWLIWGFSENFREETDPDGTVSWAPTVRPPRLGGSVRKGVFATRSPNRPNPIGLSSVRLTGLREDPEKGVVLEISGADLLDGTPVYDIKPYIPYTDSHPEAAGSFAERHARDRIQVVFPEEMLCQVPETLQKGLLEVLGQDPRGAYEKNPGYEYGMAFGGMDIRFTVEDDILTVIGVTTDGEHIK